jgi:hypothetical protein
MTGAEQLDITAPPMTTAQDSVAFQWAPKEID